MGYLKVSIVLLISLLYVADVFGQFGMGRGGGFGRGNMGNGFGSERGGFNGRGSISGGGGSFGRGNSNRRYRSTLYNDDDVYGYEANYPGGEALYVNYRSSEARAKRAQEFARSSPYSSGGGGTQGYSGQQQQGGRSNRAADFEQPMW
ncbi:UNVERIFIED_CONTAM: hypothetical protein PYX00_008970 [Menopon gallinae]|uniref:Uncharacterized protein n=1 Tax=Menopon gallinae TaxID=328185 RepID=A0AAW2H9K7_9NEOP